MRRLLLAGVLLAAGCGGRPPGALLKLPDFAMTSVTPGGEAPFGRRELLGRRWIAGFIFTRCSGPCPLLTERLARLSRDLPPSVGVLCVTVDPDGDTPARLRAYARQRDLPSGRWVLLRGDREQTYRLLYAGFRLPMSTQPRAPAEFRVTHSTRFVLIDKDAAIRGFYDGLDDRGNDRLARDARRLVEEGS